MDQSAITYWTEEVKEHNSRLEKLDDILLSLIKFYFIVAFSLITVVVTIYDKKILENLKFLIPWVFLLPLFLFGIAVLTAIKRIIAEYNFLEINRNQVREFIIYGELKNELKLFRTPLESFYTLISWMVILNFLGFLYAALPFVQVIFSKTIIYVVSSVFVASVLSSIILVSLNSARQKARDASRKATIASLRVILEMYKDENGSYPIAKNMQELFEVAKKYITSPIFDPVNKNDFYFNYVSENGQSYSIRYKLDIGGEKIIGPNDEIQ